MLINHVVNVSTRLIVGLKTKKGLSACCRILSGSHVAGGLKDCRRLLTGIGGPLSRSTSRILTSKHTSSVSELVSTNELTRQRTFRYVHLDQGPVTCITRSVMFEDTQMYKVVHGGVYLELTEEAGEMAVKKYCSETHIPQNLTAVPALTRIEKTQFLGMAALGDVLQAESEIIYTAPQSLRVLVSLYASPIVQSKARKLICRSWVWYVLVNGDNITEILPVPQLEVKDAKLEEEGRLELEANMADRQRRQNVKTMSKMDYSDLASATSTHIIDKSFSGWKSFSKVGPVLKWMDELSGYLTMRYSQVHCVTGSCDDVNVYLRLVPGCYVGLTAAVVFTSSQTLDIQCFADVETIQDGHVIKERAAEAFFTFVVRKNSSKQPPMIRQFTPKTELEKETFEMRLKVYQKRKQNSKSTTAAA